MTVESASYISQLDTTLPTAADLISEGDDHLRLTKTVLKTQFPNFGTTAITASAAEVNYLVGVTGPIQPQLSNQVAGPIHAAPDKTTPVDADELGITDSAASWGLKKLTFANLRTWLTGFYVGKTGAQVMAGDLTVPSLNGGQLAGLRNKVINGDFTVWQRGTSFGTGNIYTADRWAAAGATGQTVTRVADHPINGSSGYCIEVVNTGGAQWVYQRIESINLRDLVGKTVTASCWVKVISAGGGASLDVSRANALDDWSATTSIGSSVATNSSSWTQHTYSFTFTAEMAYGLMLRVITSGGAGGAATVRIAAVQLEVGSAATSLESRHYGLELALCQRYYYRTVNNAGAGMLAFGGDVVSATAAFAFIPLPVPMRVAPTSIETTGVAADYSWLVGATSFNVVPTYNSSSSNSIAMVSLAGSGMTVGQSVYLLQNSSASAFIGVASEL